MHTTSFVLRELKKPVGVPLRTLGYRDFTGNPDWSRNLISFTSLVYDPARERLFCGMTAFDCDLMYAFDPTTGKSEDFGVIEDERDGTRLFIGHDIAIADDHTVFVGETDTSDRAGRLWRCVI